MVNDFTAAWSIALSIWLFGASVLVFLRLIDVWDDGWRVRCLTIGALVLVLSLGIRNLLTAHLFANDFEAIQSFMTLQYQWVRLGTTLSCLMIGGSMSYPRCGHRGWISLLVIGLMSGLAVFLYLQKQG